MALFRRHRAAEPPRPGAEPGQWRLAGWQEPDLVYADRVSLAKHRDWELYVPNLELVPCGEVVKPALFFKIGRTEFDEWSGHVVPHGFSWNWYQITGDSPYVLFCLAVLFVNQNRTMIGVGGTGQITVTTADSARYGHQLRCRTFLDPADRAHRAAVEAWATAPSPTVMFFVEENFRATTYVYQQVGPDSGPAVLDSLAEADHQLRADPGNLPGNFTRARELAREDLPPVSFWRD